jgi:hypothetical protein
MILLTATVITTGGFRFRVEAPGRDSLETDDPAAAAAVLSDLGVDNPRRYITHAQDWGVVEIAPAAGSG